MKILLLSSHPPGAPEATSHGVHQRLGVMVDALRALGEVHALFFHSESRDGADTEALEAACRARWDDAVKPRFCPQQEDAPGRTFFDAYVAPAFSARRHGFFRALAGPAQCAALRSTLEALRPDLVFAHRLDVTFPLFACGMALPPLAMDLDDIEHRVFWRMMTEPPIWPGKRLSLLQWPRLAWAERRALARSAVSFVCSCKDEAYLRGTLGVPQVRAVPNSTRLPALMPLPSDPTFLFLGTFTYLPNRQAAQRLVASIWPRIRARAPAARLVVAGDGSKGFGESRSAPGIEWRGFVPDLDALYRETRVVLCPISVGGGTRIKIIEAGAHARPVVSTTIGAEGLELAPEGEILLRDDDEAFAEACLALIENDARAAALGLAARARVEATYGRDAVVERVKSLILRALARPAPRTGGTDEEEAAAALPR